MDLRVIMVAVLLVQSVLPAPICAGSLAQCFDGREACVGACAPTAARYGCCAAAGVGCGDRSCERRSGDEAPCRPVCVPCPLGQPLAPTRAPTQATPAELALLPAGPVLIIKAVRGGDAPATVCFERHGPIVGPEFRSVICVWLI